MNSLQADDIKIPMTGKYGTGKYLILDLDDVGLYHAHQWHVSKAGYLIRNEWIRTTSSKTCKTILFHVLINKTPVGMETDHINGNRLDNRKENLRTVTSLENARNTKMKTSSKKYKGVFKNSVGRWMVSTHVGYKLQYWGTYDSEEVAAHVYDYVIFKYFGEFSRLNFPGDGPLEEYNPENIRTYRYKS